MSPGLSMIDWVVVGTYLALVLCVGFYSSGKLRSAQDFFLGSKSLPWWAATLSIIATETSAVTYIGTPRFAYGGDWAFLQLVIGFVVGRVLLAVFLVPIFYRHEILTAYGYLERRFGNATRTAAALLFLFGRFVGSGVRLYAGCLAVQVATGLPLSAAVLVLGSLGMAYTLAGGIRAVVWTDVLLGTTFIAGGMISVLYLASILPEGLQGLVSDPAFSEKIRVFHGGWSQDSLVAGLAGGCVLTLATHGTDQDVVQRILTCRSSQGGRLSIFGSAVLILPLMLLFLCVGTLLYFHHQAQSPAYDIPEDLNYVFPLFIVRELPRGVSGLVMAGLFAASLSSFASVLNALAATTLNDFYKPVRRWLGSKSEATEQHLFRFSRGAAFAWGLALVGIALMFQGSSDNVLKVALKVLTYFYGALLGAFLLGAFTRRGSNLSMVSGMSLSVLAVLALQLREFLADESLAPESIRSLLAQIPPGTVDGFLQYVPTVAWPYWIVLGTAVSFGVGLLGSRGIVAK